MNEQQGPTVYSTENYIQYLMINQNGKEHKKGMYRCITESLCCTAVINTTLYINYTPILKKRNILLKRILLQGNT